MKARAETRVRSCRQTWAGGGATDDDGRVGIERLDVSSDDLRVRALGVPGWEEVGRVGRVGVRVREVRDELPVVGVHVDGEGGHRTDRLGFGFA